MTRAPADGSPAPEPSPLERLRSHLPPPMLPSRRPDDGRNAGLDVLRTAACLLVVAFHLHSVANVDFGPLNPIIGAGDAGVYVFFALSGYLLFKPFVRGRVDLRAYGIKRAARIAPGYLVALVVLAALTRNPLPIDHPLPYLTLTASYDLGLRSFLGNAWTLSAEVIFYALLPVIAVLVRGREILRLAMLGLLSVLLAMVQRLTLSVDNAWLIGAFPFVFYAFVPGMVLAVVEVRRPALFRALAQPWSILLGLAALVFETQTRSAPFALGAGLGTPLLMGWLLQHRLPGARVFAFTGGASYALYLWHKDLVIAFGGLGGLTLALVGAAASWAFVERPVLDWAHRLTRAHRSPSDLAVDQAPVPIG